MRIPIVYVAGLLALALAGGPARAQEGGLGLDLSGDANTQPQQPPPDSNEGTSSEGTPPDSSGMGMDLSGGLDLSGAVGPGADLMPRFVFLGLETPDKAGAAVAKRWMGWLQSQALRTGQVTAGADPAEAQQQLEGEYETALRCGDGACFRAPADTLDADLVTTGRLALEDGRWTLRLWTYDRDRGVVETDEVSGRKPADGNFIRQGGAMLAKRVTELARPRAMLKVSSNVSAAVVRVGERMLGVGNIETKLPPGEVQLIVEADDYTPYTKTLTLTSGKTEEVQVRLELNGPTPEGPPADAVATQKKPGKSSSGGGASVFSRPALYTTLVGLATVGVGAVLGASSKGVISRAQPDANGVLGVTRAEYQAAQQQGSLATALMAGGGALAGGSLLWLVIVPARAEPPSSSLGPVSSGAGKSGTTLNLVIGGSF
ncbi:PEGA domain-containing protein [Archangium sp.]|uniref:PEGA domain-containing protein n=1 Tax=Archangium sp. TaxID=1872627 RepID=UPI00286C58CA|nr:PEGA domain-containing protein [Archangium sp.]